MKLLQVLTQDTHWPVFPSVFPRGFLMNPEPNADTLFLQTSGWGRSQAEEIGTWASSSFFSWGVEMAQKGICCKGRLSLIVGKPCWGLVMQMAVAFLLPLPSET